MVLQLAKAVVLFARQSVSQHDQNDPTLTHQLAVPPFAYVITPALHLVATSQLRNESQQPAAADLGPKQRKEKEYERRNRGIGNSQGHCIYG